MQSPREYVAEQLRTFLKKGERVLICLDDNTDPAYGIFSQAVTDCGGVAVHWGEDLRWKTLLRIAFTQKIGTIIGPPLVILGLGKLARAKATPLYIHNAVTTGYPCRDWMEEGINNGLDCCIRKLDLNAAGCSCVEHMPDKALLKASREIMEWTSVLDCRLERQDGGLEIDIVVFPGEKLPKLPTCAKLSVRSWNPDTDCPFGV